MLRLIAALRLQRGPIGGDAARKAAEAELRKAQYHRDDPGVITRVLNWLGDRLSSIGHGTPSGSATLLIVALFVAVVIFAIWRAGRPRRLARINAAALDPLAPDATIDHRQRAADFEKRGDYAQAMREWLRATIDTIEKRGILDPRPGRTGAGVAREAGALLPSTAADLDRSVTAFEQVWFGGRAATLEDATAAHRVADAVRTARVDSAVALAGYAAPQ